MKEIIDKLSSYNLFNYLLPGTIFVVILNEISIYSLRQDDLIVAAFVYYFIGLVTSRFGSLIIEPLLKKVKFLKFADYKSFIIVSKKDPQIEILSEANNMYRTFVAMITLLLLLKIYEAVDLKNPELQRWNLLILSILLLIMFLFAYRKQTQYIAKRIKSTIENQV